MLLSQLLAIYFYSKIILAFAYLLKNDSYIISAIDADLHNIGDRESNDKKSKAAIRKISEYSNHNEILFVFSVGLPYWLIILIIHSSN